MVSRDHLLIESPNMAIDKYIYRTGYELEYHLKIEIQRQAFSSKFFTHTSLFRIFFWDHLTAKLKIASPKQIKWDTNSINTKRDHGCRTQ